MITEHIKSRTNRHLEDGCGVLIVTPAPFENTVVPQETYEKEAAQIVAFLQEVFCLRTQVQIVRLLSKDF